MVDIPHFDLPFRFGGSVPAATNLIPNGGFEKDAAGWGLVQVTAGSYDPSASGIPYVFGSKICSIMCLTVNSAWANWNYIPCTPGKTYTMSAYMLRHQGARQAGLQLSWYDASSVFISQVNIYDPLSAVNTWKRLTATSTAPANAASMVPYLIFSGGTQAINDNFFVDGVQLEEGAVATPYIDTNGAVASRTGNSCALVVEQDSIEDVSNCVVAILATRPGWRDEVPTFGTVDFAMRKMPLGAEDIATYIGSQEPRAILLVDEHRDAVDSLVARVNVGVSIHQKKGTP